MLELCNLLLRTLYLSLNEKPPSDNFSGRPSPLSLLVVSSTRMKIVGVLHLIKLYHLNIQSLIHTQSGSPSSIGYLRHILSILERGYPHLNTLGNFFSQLHFNVDETNPELLNSSVLTNIYPHKHAFESIFAQLYQWPAHLPRPELDVETNMIEMTLSGMVMFSTGHKLIELDVITKKPIQGPIMTCSRCQIQRGQFKAHLGDAIAAYDSIPPWHAAFEDYCLCGGAWR